MKSVNVTNKTNTPLLSEKQTALFLESLTKACVDLNPNALETLFELFPIQGFEDKDSFLEEAYNILSFGPDHPAGIEVRSVTPFQSRCSACILGKIVSAYRVNYIQHNDDPLPGGMHIIYQRSFALYVNLYDNRLIDFGWCNFFLNEKEIQELTY